mgnify:CR=1 FL=1
MWEIFSKIATALLGSIATGVVTHGLNAAFAPKPPSRGDVQRDLQMQAETMANASRPVRTAEQERADKIAIEQSEARQATFKQLSGEYAKVQAAGPQTIWDPYEEQRIRQESMAEAAVRGMGESGQAQDWTARRLDEARLRRSGAAQQMHETKLSNLRQQMVPYSTVEKPGAATQVTPNIQGSPLPRAVANPFSASPVDIAAALRPDPAEVERENARKRSGRETESVLYSGWGGSQS